MYLPCGAGNVQNIYWYCHSCLYVLPVPSANFPCVPIVHCKLPKCITCSTNKSELVLASPFTLVTNIFHWWAHYSLMVLPKVYSLCCQQILLVATSFLLVQPIFCSMCECSEIIGHSNTILLVVSICWQYTQCFWVVYSGQF